MEFLKNNRLFDFVYGGKPFAELTYQTQQTEDGDTLTTVYTLPDGLKITNIATKHGDAYEWVNWWENTSNQPTEIISQLWDASVELPMPHEEERSPYFEEVTAVYAPTGSQCVHDEFSSRPEIFTHSAYVGHIPPGSYVTYATSGGRSSNQNAPFFNVHKDGKGYICAIGWTGQWNSYFLRTPDTVIIKVKIEDTYFRLLPGEKIRTASFAFVPYAGTLYDGQNKWRRLVKKHYSLIGKEGRDSVGPLCTGTWGRMQTELVKERIQTIRENGLPFEYFWMDAGWYGGQADITDEAQAKWYNLVGDWTVDKQVHPQGLEAVSAAVHEAGMKYLLWFEPERAKPGVSIVKAHPEYFLDLGSDKDKADRPTDETERNILLNLGNEDAWQWCYDMLSEAIRRIGIDCYRQDFNMDPLAYWRNNDTEDRRGITEIKHIMGLYRLWDALLEEFPHLLIDNCASGGRRIDIETLRRSIPLWRSDYQCPDIFPPEGTQCHHLNFSTWMPYSGTGTGCLYDTYRMRSGYAPALLSNHCFYERNLFDMEKMDWFRGMLEEYLKVRPYMSEDFYPLTRANYCDDTWSAAQFNRPEQSDGIVQVFRREKSPHPMAEFKLSGLDSGADYIFTDADTGEETVVNGKTLMTQGFSVTMPQKRSSKIFFYQKK